MQLAASKASTQASGVLAVEVWLTAWMVMQFLLPSSLVSSLLIAPLQTDGERKPERKGWNGLVGAT
jgi:hypothetical protein